MCFRHWFGALFYLRTKVIRWILPYEESYSIKQSVIHLQIVSDKPESDDCFDGRKKSMPTTKRSWNLR